MSGRRLSPEEKKLWRHVTRDVSPRAPISTMDDIMDGDGGAPDQVSKASLRQSGAAVGLAQRRAVSPIRPAQRDTKLHAGNPLSVQSALTVNAIGAGDPQADKRVARRRQPIERVLDLHGLTQVYAEKQLQSFLNSAQRDGCRCVLVITGKGGRKTADVSTGRGVLHRRLPEWVNGAALRALIARVAPAHQKDGGAGAWYVFLKRR